MSIAFLLPVLAIVARRERQASTLSPEKIATFEEEHLAYLEHVPK